MAFQRPHRPPPPAAIRDLAAMLAAFGGATALAALCGAANFGTALAFGQIGFALALVAVLARG